MGSRSLVPWACNGGVLAMEAMLGAPISVLHGAPQPWGGGGVDGGFLHKSWVQDIPGNVGKAGSGRDCWGGGSLGPALAPCYAAFGAVQALGLLSLCPPAQNLKEEACLVGTACLY